MKTFNLLFLAFAFTVPLSVFSQTWTIDTIRSGLIGAWTRAGDFDLDSDPDVLVQNGDTIFWYENLRPGWAVHLIDTTFYNALYGFVDVVDLDSDGDLDVIKAPSSVPGQDTLTWNENQANGSVWIKHSIVRINALLGWLQSAYGDLDDDGDLDIVVPEYEFDSIPSFGSLYWLENNDGVWSKHPLRPENHWWSSLADLDGDGDLDIASSRDGVFWLENQLPDTSWTVHYVIPSGPFNHVLGACADVTGDGAAEIISTPPESNGGVVYYANPGWEEININPTGQNLYIGPIGDIDDDGDADVPYGGAGYLEQGIGWAENQDDGATWVVHDITAHDLIQRIPTGLGDIDGDGDTDIISLTFDVNTGAGSAIWAANPKIVSGVTAHTALPLEFDFAPNPTSGNAQMTIPAEPGEVFQVAIFDFFGRQCANYSVTSGTPHSIDLTGLPQGAYWVRVWNEERVGVKKVVKG